jgi:predicted Na+-dependent transporter
VNPAKLIAAVMLVTLTFGAGLEVNRAHLAAILKNANLLVKAIVANFVLVPIYGVLIARGFDLRTDIATGFLLMAIAPGVPFLMMGARKKGGRLGLAVTMALLFPLLSVVTVPITASIVLPPEMRASLPLAQFVTTLLLLQFVPLLVGMVLAHRLPALAARLERPAKLLCLLALIVLFAALAPRLVRDVGAVYGSRGMFAMLCIVLLSVVTGWLMGGPDEPERRTLSIGTALRNIGLCALVATAGFGAESRVASTVLVYLLIQFILTAIIGVFFTRSAKAEAVVEEPAT